MRSGSLRSWLKLRYVGLQDSLPGVPGSLDELDSRFFKVLQTFRHPSLNTSGLPGGRTITEDLTGVDSRQPPLSIPHSFWLNQINQGGIGQLMAHFHPG